MTECPICCDIIPITMTECPICCEIITTDIYELSCKHKYCIICAQKINKCAICRADIISNYTDYHLQLIYPNNKLDEILELPEVKTLYFDLPITYTINCYFNYNVDDIKNCNFLPLIFSKYIKLTTYTIIDIINNILNSNIKNNPYNNCDVDEVFEEDVEKIIKYRNNRHFTIRHDDSILFDSKSDKIFMNLFELYFDRDSIIKYSWATDFYINFFDDMDVDAYKLIEHDVSNQYRTFKRINSDHTNWCKINKF
jgi:hypothetical protein